MHDYIIAIILIPVYILLALLGRRFLTFAHGYEKGLEDAEKIRKMEIKMENIESEIKRENIELVITMPEKLYKHIMSMAFFVPGRSCGKTTLAEILAAIRTGKPLPKGHGDLKDADVMKNKLCTNEANKFFGSTTCAEILDFINDEKPIIEADREGEE